MKYPISAILLAFTSIAFTACNKEEITDNATSVQDFTSLKVDGVYLEDTESGGGYVSGSNVASVSGDFADGSVLFIMVEDAGTNGDYTLDAATDDCVYTTSDGVIYSLSNGASHISFTIDEIQADGVIRGLKGSFEGELYSASGDVIAITEGAFSDL